ncbi:MAG: 30S ribosomal protein S1 [Spirochaetaceae bacterium]|jgi:small subunit ribosomal protein S1|nr:30S ribosomal protein S1 [Spirochaetaceae bacterium]
MVIAIDGPAGTGKSTIAKMLAEAADLPGGKYVYVNSGNLYRAITLGCLRAGIGAGDEEAALAYARGADIAYREDGAVSLNGEDVSPLLHTDEIDGSVARLSSIVPIRHIVNSLVRRVARGVNVVVEGRDMTSVVFPDAEFRFYLDASVDARAGRRHAQGVSERSLPEIRSAIVERDEIDRNKDEGSLRIEPGAVYVDTSDLTITQVYETLIRQVQKKGKSMGNIDDSEDIKTADSTESAIQTQLQEEYLKTMEQLEEGQLVNGTVIQVTPDQVFIDVGYKSEGKIPIAEFETAPVVGDEVQVILVTKENKYGEVIVSKQKADVKIFWKKLRQAFQDHSPVEGTITRQVKGGYDVFLGGDVHAFLPISQSDVQKVEKAEKFLGLKSMFYVERLYSENKINIVVNRRRWLDEETERKRQEFFDTTEIGAEVTGVVKSFTSFGAFVDLGGFDGLLHINDMSWGHVTRPRDFVKKGQEIKLKLIRIDPDEKRINLSLKHFSEDPWVHFNEKYHVNDIVKGRVTKLTDFGAFIELEEGIEGLAHISEFSWIKKIQKPGELLSLGDEVECMILGYDIQAERVSLGLKQVAANPWTGIAEKYPVGTRLTRKVVKITNAGAFIELEEGIDGFLHGDDISWTKKVKRPGSELEAGQDVEVMVIAVEPENRNIKLGIKQLEEDPWKSFAETYRPGSPVEGEVASITDFGIFMKVPGGIEGLIHKTNLVEGRDTNPDEALKKFQVGDKINAVVLELQSDKQKVSFSIKDYEKKVHRDEISRYMAEEETGESTFTLGDVLKSKQDNSPGE